jgi:hypothetical protein
MKHNVILLALLGSPIFCQQMELKQMAEHAITLSGGFSSAHTVQGAPYSATVINESIQTLADGNRIVQKTTGTTARDSQGRTRNDAGLPMIGNLSPAKAPHLAFISDPVAQTSYTLNLDEKTAHVMLAKVVSDHAPGPGAPGAPEGPVMTKTIFATTAGLAGGVPGPMAGGITMSIKSAKEELDQEHTQSQTEDLGMQVIEGVNAQGTRSTRTIPAGEIGNDQPIKIVTEVWTSPELKTIVMSKRTDPRSGEQTFRLTNIMRTEPDASLFTVPADFKSEEGDMHKNVFFYRNKE